MNDLGESPRLGMAVVGRLSRMYDLQVSLRQSAYGGVRAVLIVPRSMITTGPAPGIAHGIGATSRPTSDIDLADMKHVVPARSTHRKPSPLGARPATGPVAPAARPAAPIAPVAMEDELPVVTEWTMRRTPATPQPRPRTAGFAPPPRAARRPHRGPDQRPRKRP